MEQFVYLLEALVSPAQINNTPHPYSKVQRAHSTIQGDECNAYPCAFEIYQISSRDKSETLSSNMSVRGVHGSRFLDIDKVRKCFPIHKGVLRLTGVVLVGTFQPFIQKRKKPPELLPRAISCKRRSVLHQFNFTGDDFEDASLRSISCRVSLHPDATDDMDSRSFLVLVQISDGVTLPCDDAELGSVNDLTAILRGLTVVGRNGEIGNFGVHEVLHT